MRFLVLIFTFIVSLTASAQMSREEADIISATLSLEKTSKACPKILLRDSTVLPHSHDYYLTHVLIDDLKYDTALARLFPSDTIRSLFLTEHNSFTYSKRRLPTKVSLRVKLGSGNKKKMRECGYYSVGTPFINSSKDISIVYLAYDCGPLCASGYLIFLKYEAKEKRWLPVSKKRLWIS